MAVFIYNVQNRNCEKTVAQQLLRTESIRDVEWQLKGALGFLDVACDSYVCWNPLHAVHFDWKIVWFVNCVSTKAFEKYSKKG